MKDFACDQLHDIYLFPAGQEEVEHARILLAQKLFFKLLILDINLQGRQD